MVCPVEQSEYVLDQTRPFAGDAGSPPGLAQVLARKARGHKVDVWQAIHRPDVVDERGRREAVPEHPLCRRIPLAQDLRLMAGGVKSNLNSADASEQRSYP